MKKKKKDKQEASYLEWQINNIISEVNDLTRTKFPMNIDFDDVDSPWILNPISEWTFNGYPASVVLEREFECVKELADDEMARFVSRYTYGYCFDVMQNALAYMCIDKLIKKADEAICLVSPSEYIRECKKWFMEKDKYTKA